MKLFIEVINTLIYCILNKRNEMSKVRVDRLEDLNGDNGILVSDLNKSVQSALRVLKPALTFPATRDNGSPLQVGDIITNLTDGFEYKYMGSGWLSTDISFMRNELLLYGADMAGYTRKVPTARMDRVQDRLDALYLNPWEKVNLVVKPDPADQTTWDWAPALQSIINDAFSTVGYSRMYSANINHSGVVIDLGGKSYPIKSMLQIPNGGGVTITNGLIYAHSSFVGTYLVRMGNAEASGAFRHEKVLWDKVIFDARHKAGGVFVSNSIRCKFLGCTFIRYNTDGARTFGNCVEIHFMYCDFGIRPYNNTNALIGDLPEVVVDQVGLRLGSTDNRVLGCIFHRGRAIIAQAQAQHISACQFYGSDPWGSAIDIKTSDVTVIDCAFGKLSIRIYSPFNVIICNNMFVMENIVVDDWAISLIPGASGEWMSGVQIYGNDFRKVGGSEVCKSIKYDTSVGTISRVRSSRIRDNTHYYVKESCLTQAKVTQLLSVQSSYTFDFSGIIEFGVPSEARVEFMQNSGASTLVQAGIDGNLAQLSRTAVPVKLSAASNGSLQAFLSVEESPVTS